MLAGKTEPFGTSGRQSRKELPARGSWPCLWTQCLWSFGLMRDSGAINISLLTERNHQSLLGTNADEASALPATS